MKRSHYRALLVGILVMLSIVPYTFLIWMVLGAIFTHTVGITRIAVIIAIVIYAYLTLYTLVTILQDYIV